MSIVKISAKEVASWKGRIIDVRGYDEFSAERLEGAECVPLDHLLADAGKWDRAERLLLMCKSGMRSQKACDQLVQVGFTNLCMLEGGIEACKQAGVEVIRVRVAIPIFRQVMIVAGIILLIGLFLTHVSRWFILIDWFVALGLVIGGATGYCPMARLLAVMPWNASARCCNPKSCG